MIYRYRRYARAKADEAKAYVEPPLETHDPIELIWEAKREATPPVEAMPGDFPYAARLADAGYSAIDELRGATERELRTKGFLRREAKSIFDALAAIPEP